MAKKQFFTVQILKDGQAIERQKFSRVKDAEEWLASAYPNLDGYEVEIFA